MSKQDSKTAEVKNQAIFQITTYVTLTNVSEVELENSDVLNGDVMMQLRENVNNDMGIYDIVLNNVLEFDAKGGNPTCHPTEAELRLLKRWQKRRSSSKL